MSNFILFNINFVDMKRHMLIPMMMISSELFYVGWVIVVGHTKKIVNLIPND